MARTPREGRLTRSSPVCTEAALGPHDGSERDVNFASIMDLDVGGGWHVVRLAADGKIATSEAIPLKVLRQFFPDDNVRGGLMPAALADRFLESSDWGLSRKLRRQYGHIASVRDGLQLVVHFIPDPTGAYLLLKIRRLAMEVPDCSSLPLTLREQGVAALVAAGKTNTEIGILLGISARTVQKHLENIFRKLGVETRTAVAVRVLSMAAPDAPGIAAR